MKVYYVYFQNLLKSLPQVQHLGLSGCDNIGDDAFLINKSIQLRSSMYATKVNLIFSLSYGAIHKQTSATKLLIS